jgi:hypothetical protein
MTEDKWMAPPPCPTPVMYKYLHGNHAHDLLRLGRVRITTLYECRAWEHEELGDPEEGKGTLTQTVTDGIFSPENPLRGPLAKAFAINAQKVVMQNVTGKWDVDSQDCYLYCMTLRPDFGVMKRFGYDACLRISNPWRFISAISSHLWRQRLIRGAELNNCFYESRDRVWQEGQPPAVLIKDLRFQHQQEARAFWLPINLPISPLFIESPSAASHCEIFPLYK